MTRCLLAITLTLTPAPLQAPKEPTWPSVMTTNAPDVDAPSLSTSFWVDESLLMHVGSPPTVLSAPTATPPPPDPPPLTLRERALNRLTELGAPQWVVNAFDCVGWYESKWQNVRSKTGDDGTLQVNDVHDPELRRLGLDPYVPEDAASFSWLLFTRAGWSFRDWTVRGACGLR